MNTYIVTRKSDGVEICRYQADAPQDWQAYPFTEFLHSETSPEEVVAPSYSGSWRISKFAFRNRFTLQEKITLEIGSLDQPQASLQARSAAAMLRAFTQDVAVASYIDLKRPDTDSGVRLLEANGLLTVGRATVILETPPTDAEVFNG